MHYCRKTPLCIGILVGQILDVLPFILNVKRRHDVTATLGNNIAAPLTSIEAPAQRDVESTTGSRSSGAHPGQLAI